MLATAEGQTNNIYMSNSNFGGQKEVGRGQKIFVLKFFLNYIYQKATEKTIAIIIF